MHPQPVDVSLIEPAERVLLHRLPRRLDHQVLRDEPGQAGGRVEEREEVAVDVVRLLDVAGGLDGGLPVAGGDQVAAGDLAAEAGEVVGRQLQRRDQLDDRHVVDRILGERVIVLGQAIREATAGVDVEVGPGERLERHALASLGFLLDDGPRPAVGLGERLRRVPVDRRQDRPDRLRPPRGEDVEDDPRRDPGDARQGRRQPAPLQQPEEPQADIGDEWPDE